MISKIFIKFFPRKNWTHILSHILSKCVVGSHQPFLININYHKIPLRIFLGGPTYCQNMRFKICGRSRSDLKMSNNKHSLILLRIFVGDIRIPPWPKPLPPLNPRPHPTPLPLHPCPIFLPEPLPHPFPLAIW